MKKSVRFFLRHVRTFSALLLVGIILCGWSCRQTNDSQNSTFPESIDDNFNFIVANDMGRNGY